MAKRSVFVSSKELIERLRKAKKKHPNLLTGENLLAAIREELKHEQ